MQTRSEARQPFALVPEHSFEEKWELAQRRYKGTIRTFARNCVHQLPNMDMEDIEQELLVVLWKAVLNYDPDKGASFNTLFQGSARNRCISLIRTASTKSRTGISVSLDEEAVAAAVEEAFGRRLGGADAEREALACMELSEYLSEHGPDALLNPRRGRPRKVA